MQCPHCAAELLSGSTLCPHCGQPLTALPPSFPPDLSFASLHVDEPPVNPLWSVIRVAIAVLCAILAAFIRYDHKLSAEATGFWIGSLIIPTFVAVVIVRVRPHRNIVMASWIFLGLTVFTTAGYIFVPRNTFHSLSKPEQMRRLTGVVPLDWNASEDERETVAATKQVFADLRQASADYYKAQGQLTPDLNEVYTLKSFADAQTMQHMIDVVQQKLAIDQKLNAISQGLPTTLESNIRKTHLPDREKQDFIDGIQRGMGSMAILDERKQMVAIEENWNKANTDLYGYCIEHVSHINAKSSPIIINDAAVRTQFNTRFTAAKNLRHDFNASVRKLNKDREDFMKTQGFTASDLGLPK